MESDKPFEGYKPDIFPRLTKVADWLLNHISFLPNEVLSTHSDHDDHSRGAEHMLATELAAEDGRVTPS